MSEHRHVAARCLIKKPRAALQKRSEAVGEEQPGQLRKTVRFEQAAFEFECQQRLQNQLLLWNILRAVRHKIGWGPYLCRSQVMLMTTYKFPAFDPFYEMDGRKSRYIGGVSWNGIEEKMPEISREVN